MFRRAGERPLIMGILNITPDSFSDGGKYQDIERAFTQVQQMLAEGADIIDIGGESSRPGAESVAIAEQLHRVLPVIQKIRQSYSENLLISIDTTQSAVALAALESGANIINDISAGSADARMLQVAAEQHAGIILMHMQGTPQTMQENPTYDDVVQQILDYLLVKVDAALQAGISSERIAIDPGIGFGKRKRDNLALLANLQRFTTSGYPVLLGTSRKRFMGNICQVDKPADLVTATAVTTALGVMAGVRLFRVHDVQENRQAADVAWAILKSQKADP